MANLEVLALDTAVPQIRAPGAGDGYSVPRDITLSNNLIFGSTAQRITGDMSNATLASRLSFQSSTTNGVTSVQLIPNGTATTSNIRLFNGTDTANSANATLQVSSAETTLTSGITGTGTYLPMTFYTGGSERMRLDTSGNLGIGNTVASTINTVNGVGNLVVGSGSGSEGITIYTGTADTGGIAFADGTTTTDTYRGYINYAHATDHMAFWTSASEKMRIDSSGNVGIGTASPGSKLDVSSSSSNIVASRSTGGYAAFQRVAPTGQQVYDFYTVNNVEVARITADGSNFLTFSTGSSATERMRIDSSGNVGIGTTSFGASSQVVLAIANATAVPTGNPTGGGVLYVEAGALKYRGSSGTVTTIANA